MLMKLVWLEILDSREIRTRPENTQLNIYEKSGQVIRKTTVLFLHQGELWQQHHGDLDVDTAVTLCISVPFLQPMNLVRGVCGV